jgi:uncharacterized protein YdhG (YjbR/CyaY superfamily)
MNQAVTPDKYISNLPDDRKEVISKLRSTILNNLPTGFEEIVSSGMLGYVVPLSLYSQGYHAGKNQPLPFINLASQKNYISLYHLGLYADDKLLKWFSESYEKIVAQKLDIGKSCIRFKKLDSIPFKLIGELVTKMSPQQWITQYEKSLKQAHKPK